MKKQLQFIGVLIALGITITTNSCKKETVTPVNLANPETASGFENHGLGALVTSPEIYASLPVYDFDENSRAVQPLSYLQPHPPVGDQGQSEACAAWAIGYAARAIAYRASHASTTWSKTKNIFSPEFVYNSLNGGNCNVGLTPTSIFNLFKNQGVCTWSKMPFVVGQCTTPPTPAMKANAAIYKIANQSWGTIPLPGNNTAALGKCVNAIKTKILAGNTVVVALKVETNYDHLGSNQIMTQYNPATIRGNHLNVIVGYNETQRYFILQNSWGKSWASGGLGRISYDVIKTGCWYELYYMNKQ